VGIQEGEGKGMTVQFVDIGVNPTHRSFQSDREGNQEGEVAPAGGTFHRGMARQERPLSPLFLAGTTGTQVRILSISPCVRWRSLPTAADP
jgi:hypothetical protein